MGWRAGLAECYPLSENCVLDWSAIATASAAIVALGVGATPILLQYFDRRRRGRANARIAVAAMEIQALSISAAIEVCKTEMSGAEYNEVLETVQCLDVPMARSLVDYMDVFKPKTRKLIVDFATRTDTVARAQRRHRPVSATSTVHSNGFFGIYEMYLALLVRCQAALAEEVALQNDIGQYRSSVPTMIEEIRRRAGERK